MLLKPDPFYHSNDNTDSSPLISNLRTLMQRHNLSEAKLARVTNIPQPTLHKILAGKTSDPRISTIKILADYFETSIDDLYTGIVKSDTATVQHDKTSVPVISWQDCVRENSFLDRLSHSNWEAWLSSDFTKKHLFALITKPSMEPLFSKGTILIIDSQKNPKDGDLVVVYYSNSKEGTLRKLTIDGPNVLLVPLNTNLPSDNLNDNIKILGVVCQSRNTYE